MCPLMDSSVDASIFLQFGRWSSDAGFEKISDSCELSDTGENTGSTDMQFQNNYTGIHFNIVTHEVYIGFQ